MKSNFRKSDSYQNDPYGIDPFENDPPFGTRRLGSGVAEAVLDVFVMAVLTIGAVLVLWKMS